MQQAILIFCRHAPPLDENGACCARQNPNTRPSAHFGFRHEYHRPARIERENIKPRHMIGDNRARSLCGISFARHLEAQNHTDKGADDLRDPRS